MALPADFDIDQVVDFISVDGTQWLISFPCQCHLDLKRGGRIVATLSDGLTFNRMMEEFQIGLPFVRSLLPFLRDPVLAPVDGVRKVQ